MEHRIRSDTFLKADGSSSDIEVQTSGSIADILSITYTIYKSRWFRCNNIGGSIRWQIKLPVPKQFTGSDVTGLAEFQTADTIGITDGGTGLNAVGSAGQVLKVNSGGTALEYGAVDRI